MATLADLTIRVELLEEAVHIINLQMLELTPRTMLNAMSLIMQQRLNTLDSQIVELQRQIRVLQDLVRS